jgi:hypothetical protein
VVGAAGVARLIGHESDHVALMALATSVVRKRQRESGVSDLAMTVL